MSARPVGGDFELHLPLSGGESAPARPGAPLPLTGRAALHRILARLHEQRPASRVYLPEYLCASMFAAARAAGADVHFYAIDAELRPARLQDIPAGATVVLVRYFGLVDLATEVARLRRAVAGVVVVADEAHAPWALAEAGADVAFTSWRKAYPVIGGAPIVPQSLEPPAAAFGSAPAAAFAATRLAAAAVKALARTGAAVDDSAYLDLFTRAEAMLDEPWALDASLLAQDATAVGCLPLEAMHARRRTNFLHLAERLAERGVQPLLPLAPGATPLFLPVRVAGRDRVRRALAVAGIFCPAHWPVPPGLDLASLSPAAQSLYAEELSLVIDQRYDVTDMDRLANMLDAVLT